MKPTREAIAIAQREVALEAAGRDGLAIVGPVVLAAVIIAGLGFGPAPQVQRAVAPGLVWLVVLFTAAPLARATAAAERAEGCWDLLRTLTAPGPLFAGKLAALWLWLASTWGLAAMLVTVLLDAPLAASGVAAGLLGTLGFAAVTVVFGAIVGAADRRAGLLPLLLLPAGLPALVAGTQASTPGVAPWPWLAVLLAYDFVVLTTAWAVFPLLLEE